MYVKEWNGVVVVLHGRYSNAKGGRGRRCNVKLANCGLETSAQVLRSGHYYRFCMGYRQTER